MPLIRASASGTSSPSRVSLKSPMSSPETGDIAFASEKVSAENGRLVGEIGGPNVAMSSGIVAVHASELEKTRGLPASVAIPEPVALSVRA